MKTLHYSTIIALVLIVGTSTVFSQSSNAQIQNGSPSTDLKCIDSMTQDMKTKYALFNEERAKTAAINYDKFKSEINTDNYTFRAVSQEWTNDQVKCNAALKNVLVLFSVADTLGKQRYVTVLIDPVSYEPQGIDVKYDPPTHGGVGSMLRNQDPEFNLLYHKSPLKQFKSGIAAKDVNCHDSFLLTFKSEDGSPACVTPETAKMLYQRGWALVLTFNLNTSNLDQPVDVISILSDSSATNPGGSSIKITLKNNGMTPITSLKATLHLNNDYSFDFVNVKQSNPLASGNLTSDSKILIGAGFDTKLAYPLTISGIANNFPFNYTENVWMLHTNENSIKENSSVNTSLPVSFMPCDTPYPKSDTGIPVLYMPMNSIGKLCVRYTNHNDVIVQFMGGIRIFDPNNSYQSVPDVTTWSDLGNTTTIQKNDSFTIVYWIKTGNHQGFYGINLFCGGTPFAIGYDNSSKLVSSDFPFFGYAHSCPVILYDTQIDSMTGIGVKYIPYP